MKDASGARDTVDTAEILLHRCSRSLVRFGASSIVAAACSETMFLLLDGLVEHIVDCRVNEARGSRCDPEPLHQTALDLRAAWQAPAPHPRSGALYPAIGLVMLGLAIVATAIGDALLR